MLMTTRSLSHANAVVVFLIVAVLPIRDRLPLMFGVAQLMALTWSMWATLWHKPCRLDRHARLAVCVSWGGLGLAVVLTLLGECLGQVDLLQGVRDLRDFAIFVIVVTLLLRGGTIPSLFAIVAGGCCGMLLEYVLRGSGLYPHLYDYPFLGYRYIAGFLSPNEYGAMASVVIVLAVSIARSSFRRAILYSPAIAIGVLVLLTTASRGALLATGCGLCYALLLPVKRPRELALSVVGIVLVILTSWCVMAARADNALLGLSDRFTDNEMAFGEEHRLALAELAWEGTIDSFFVGNGLGWFSYATRGMVASPHSEILKALCELGVIGALLLGFLMAFPAWLGLRYRSVPAVRVFASACIAFAANDMFYSHLFRAKMSVFYALLLAGCLGCVARARDDSSPGDRHSVRFRSPTVPYLHVTSRMLSTRGR
jgi:hypothetical protein